MAIRVRTLTERDRPWLLSRLDEVWGGPTQAYGDALVDAWACEGLLAVDDADEPLGVLLHRAVGRGWEIVLLEALVPGSGIGTALLDACADAARGAGATWLELVTTNDNTRALRFYQRRGFRLVALRPGAVDEARRALKPSIPLTGEDGIAIRDELVLRRDF